MVVVERPPGPSALGSGSCSTSHLGAMQTRIAGARSSAAAAGRLQLRAAHHHLRGGPCSQGSSSDWWTEPPQQAQQQQGVSTAWWTEPQEAQQQQQQQGSASNDWWTEPQGQQQHHEENGKNGNGAGADGIRRFRSSWDAKEDGGGRNGDADYLYELGASQQYNINVSHGQSVEYIDNLFTGNVLGHQTDIADGSLRGYEMRTLNNIVGDYYVAPRFLETVAMHITKNTLMDLGAFDNQTRVPLILGIWGGKGMGKSFQTELAFKKLGIEPVIMSAGEMEHEVAGTPGRLIRERYRRAAEISKVRGKLSCLMINDIDAGIGHFANTQVTVNNQIVVATLMNLCDNPNKVSIGGDWLADERIRRVPIIVTGNDLSTCFAPLLRDGRMDKFYWKPSNEDLANILYQMYKDDGLQMADMEALMAAFPAQPLDFFGAIRASTYDNQIREWIRRDVVQGELVEENENLKDMGRRLLDKEGLPEFKPVQLTLNMLMAEGHRLAEEQERVNQVRLAPEYMKNYGKKGAPSILGLMG